MGKGTGSRYWWDEPPHCRLVGLVAVGGYHDADGAEPRFPGPEPPIPEHPHPQLLARKRAGRDRCDRRRHRGLPQARKSRGLAVVPLWRRRQHEHLHLPVCHLRSAHATRLAPRGRSVGLDRCLDTAHHYRPSDILRPAVSHWTVAQQALEVVGVADRSFRPGGSGPLRVLSRSVLWRTRADPQPARDRRLHQRLRGCSVHFGPSTLRRNSLCGVHETTAGRGSRAPATQMVRLRCCDTRYSKHPVRHHYRDRRTRLVRVGRERDLYGSGYDDSCLDWDSYPSLPPLRYRHTHKSNPRLRFIDGHAGRAVLRRHRCVAEILRLTHRPAVHLGSRGINPPDCGAVHSVAASHTVVYRQALLQEEI